MKILVLSWSLPPALVGSSQIISSLARQFSADEMALVGEKWPGPESNNWDDEGGTKPEVFFVHRQWPWKFQKTIRLLLIPLVFLRIVRVFYKTRPQQVLAIFPAEYYLFLGWLLAKWFRVPFYSYFHNTYLENRNGIKRWFASWLQPRIFRDSHTVFVMSDGMKEILQATYPSTKFVTLIHTYEKRCAPLVRAPTLQLPLDIAYMGSLNSSNCEALSRIAFVLKRFPDSRLTTYSGNRDSDFAELGIRGANIVHRRVAFDQVVEALRQHNVLYLPHGFTGGLSAIEYQTIFPTRTTPYLLSGVPIVAHSPAGAFLTNWLKERNCAEVVDVPSENDLVEAFQRLIDQPERCLQLSKSAQEAGLEFFAPTIASILRVRVNGTVTP